MGLFSKDKHIELKVDGMHCDHCEMRVSMALKKVPGVKDAKADHGKGVATVTYADEVDVEAMMTAVKDAGYTAHPPE
jgi:copper chaperone CopZ